jgi:hypothetical protein
VRKGRDGDGRGVLGAGGDGAEGAEPQRGGAEAAAADQRPPRHAPHHRPLRVPGTYTYALGTRDSVRREMAWVA